MINTSRKAGAMTNMILKRSFNQFAMSRVIPTIDIGAWTQANGDAPRKRKIAEEVNDAAARFGFLRIANHGIPNNLIDNVFKNLEDFFALSLNEKGKIRHVGDWCPRGYLGMFEQGNYAVDATDKREDAQDVQFLDAKEVFQMGAQFEDHEKDSPKYNDWFFMPNEFPTFPTNEKTSEFRHVMQTYWDSSDNLSQNFYQILAAGLGMPEDWFKDKVDRGMNSLNCNLYPKWRSEFQEGQMGIGEHTDYEMFTMVVQGGTSAGLEIWMEETGWIVIEPIEGTIVVNIGDLLARWTNDRWRSTVHRARNPVASHRYSLAFFSCCNYNAIVDPADFIKNGEKARYEPLLAGEHMRKRISRANLYDSEP